MDFFGLAQLLGYLLFVFLDFVDCSLQVVDGAVDIIDELLLLADLRR